jgi:GT2 family glycosyltransferase
VPASKVWHKVGASLEATNSPAQIRYDARNRLIFYWRNRRRDFPRVLWWFNRQIFAFTLSGYQGEHARLLLRAEADFFLGKRGPIRVR